MDAPVRTSSPGAAVPGDPVVSLRDVHLSLASRAGVVPILRGIDLELPRGASVGIVGPSGSGKTTLLMAIAGLERITSGQVTVAGHDLTSMDEDALARFRRDHVGIVFQGFHLIATMTALENVAVPLEFRGTADAYDRARASLGQVGLGHRIEHYPGELSGGEQQRVAMARALAAGAELVLADEPTGNLDQHTGDEIMDLLLSLARSQGSTVLLVTHDRELAEACDHLIEVRDGRITGGGGAQQPAAAER